MLQVVVPVKEVGSMLTWDFDVIKGKLDFTLYFIPNKFLLATDG